MRQRIRISRFGGDAIEAYEARPSDEGRRGGVVVILPDRGPSGPVAVELSAPSARRLAESILAALDSATPGV